MSIAAQNARFKARDIREAIFGGRKFKAFSAVYWMKGGAANSHGFVVGQQAIRIIDAKSEGAAVLVRVLSSGEWEQMPQGDMVRKEK